MRTVFLTVLTGLLLIVRLAPASETVVFIDGLAVDLMEKPTSSEPFFRGGIPRIPFQESAAMNQRTMKSAAQDLSMKIGQIEGGAATHARAAERYIQQEEWLQAKRELDRALSIEPGNMKLIQRMASVCSLAGQYGIADAYFRRYLKANPNDVAFLVGWSSALIRLKRYDDADKALRRALDIDPGFLIARFNAEMLAMIRGAGKPSDQTWRSMNLVEALEVANWLDADKEDYVEVLGGDHFATFCEWMLGEGTSGNLKKIIYRIRMILSRLESSDWTGALEASEMLRETGFACAGLDFNEAKCRFELGETDQSISELASLVDKYPGSGMMWYGYGYVLIETEQYQGAVTAFTRASELMPKNGAVRFAIACGYAGLSRMDQAWTILEELSRTHSTAMRSWLAGDAPYIEAIRKDPRFAQIQ
ncbi:MAG: tetratricopeptide repeat protein [Verrucomicrobia bacterium]|nr:tetratricopeptide repeat protein [Verrucomicrobiota bacterium]